MMTVGELLASGDSLRLINGSDSALTREITGGYCGDLLSWVMGRAQSGDAWVTIMGNANVAAVAQLADVACVVLAEGVTPDEQLLRRAQTDDLLVLGSSLSAFELCRLIGGRLEPHKTAEK